MFGRNPKKLKELEAKYGIHPVTDMNEKMENEEIDLVDICLPNELYCTYAVQALEHKKHVLCETPVALNISDAIAMQTAQQKSGKLRKLQIQRNTTPVWGDLGQANIVTSLMCHDIDFVTYLLGRPKKVQVAKTLGKEGQ